MQQLTYEHGLCPQIDGVRYKPMRATMEPRTERGPGFREKGESSTSQSAKQRRLGTRPRKGGKLASSLKNQNNSSSSSGKGGSNTWLKIACHEGKNRQIRKVFILTCVICISRLHA
jgi:hypothetical protein